MKKECSKFYWRARLCTIHSNVNILWRTARSSFNFIFILCGSPIGKQLFFRAAYTERNIVHRTTCMSIHNNGWSNAMEIVVGLHLLDSLCDAFKREIKNDFVSSLHHLHHKSCIIQVCFCCCFVWFWFHISRHFLPNMHSNANKESNTKLVCR